MEIPVVVQASHLPYPLEEEDFFAEERLRKEMGKQEARHLEDGEPTINGRPVNEDDWRKER